MPSSTASGPLPQRRRCCWPDWIRSPFARVFGYDSGRRLVRLRPLRATRPKARRPPIATTPAALTPPMATMPTALTPPMATRPAAFPPPHETSPRAFSPPSAAKPRAFMPPAEARPIALRRFTATGPAVVHLSNSWTTFSFIARSVVNTFTTVHRVGRLHNRGQRNDQVCSPGPVVLRGEIVWGRRGWLSECSRRIPVGDRRWYVPVTPRWIPGAAGWS